MNSKRYVPSVERNGILWGKGRITRLQVKKMVSKTVIFQWKIAYFQRTWHLLQWHYSLSPCLLVMPFDIATGTSEKSDWLSKQVNRFVNNFDWKKGTFHSMQRSHRARASNSSSNEENSEFGSCIRRCVIIRWRMRMHSL